MLCMDALMYAMNAVDAQMYAMYAMDALHQPDICVTRTKHRVCFEHRVY